MKPRDLTPLLRWAGGKRWLAAAVRQSGNLVGATSYVEPFAGGAAVFFASTWQEATLGDVNPSLIKCYQGLATNPASVRKKLASLVVDRATFERVGGWKPTSCTGAAARLLYLNRTAYAGIYRENAQGRFNVPFAGDRNLDVVLRGSRIERVGAALAQAALVDADFELTLDAADERTLVFCDPPYSLPGGEGRFRRYSRAPFTWTDQVRLADRLAKLARGGSTVVLCNSADSLVRDLYGSAQVLPIVRRSSLSGSGSREHKEAVYVLHRRGRVAEELVSAIAAHVSAN